MAFLALPVSPGSLDEPGLAGLATAVAGILLGLLYASSTGVRIRRALRRRGSGGDLDPGYGDLFAIGVALVVGYPVVGFPGDPTGPDSVVNLYVHLLGFCLAFIGPSSCSRPGRSRSELPFGAPRRTPPYGIPSSPPRCPEPRVYNASMTFSD